MIFRKNENRLWLARSKIGAFSLQLPAGGRDIPAFARPADCNQIPAEQMRLEGGDCLLRGRFEGRS